MFFGFHGFFKDSEFTKFSQVSNNDENIDIIQDETPILN
jgi:hypothetical protein